MKVSTESDKYARYRPGYPQELFDFIEGLLEEKKKAWDCGTGKGQVASHLSEFMQQVEGTDISRQQLKNAIQRPNIIYSVQPAEKTGFKEKNFDLVTVAQAVHWFEMEKFFREVKRVTKPGGIIAVMGYGLFRSSLETNRIIDHFYRDIIGPYWEEERKYLEEKYSTISFPFEEIRVPDFQLNEKWSYERLMGYLRTWSAVKKYKKEKGKDPVALIEKDLNCSFGRSNKVVFPIFLRVGRIKREEALKV